MKIDGEKVFADTSLGLIEGRILDIEGRKVAQFLGIPYAQQPIGNQRFRPLKEQEPWEGVLEALAHGNIPVQPQHSSTFPLPQGEDCCFMDIHAPLPDKKAPDEKYPVMFHIPGGGFVVGTGSDPIYDFSYFSAIKSVVCISINYRLGIFGFLSLPPAIENNLGLKDAQVALKWVYDHIRAFSGDNQNVTVYGASAGAVVVHHILVSEESRPHFARAIMSSGVMTRIWSASPPSLHRLRVKKVLWDLGCPKNLDHEQKAEFLRTLPFERFENHFKKPFPWNCVNDRDYSYLSLPQKPVMVSLCAREGHILPELAFPRPDTAQGTVARESISHTISEYVFDQPLKRFMNRQMEMNSKLPLYLYVYDHTVTIHPEAFEKILKRKNTMFFSSNHKFESCHGSDVFMLLGHVKRHRDLFPPEDIKVCEEFGQFIHNFMSSDEKKLSMPVYSLEKKMYSRITAEGVKYMSDYKPKRNRLFRVKALACAPFLLAFPSKF